MEKKLHDEMVLTIEKINNEMSLCDRKIFLFGYCNATLELIDLLEGKGIGVCEILDNSDAKQMQCYKGIHVTYPKNILMYSDDVQEDNSVVLIASRYYETMCKQLREIGYKGPVCKVVDYNSYAEYDMSEKTILKMKNREKDGEELLRKLSDKYSGFFKVFCPFAALGDVYFMISYWPAFAKTRCIAMREDKPELEKAVFIVPGDELADVIHMFGDYPVEVFEQKELDSMIQASIYRRDNDFYIAHQDRPYVVNLSKALYVKKIVFSDMYCCGVYGLSKGTMSIKPKEDLPVYKDIDSIPSGRSVIFSPYAKSVVAIDSKVWSSAVQYYVAAGYKCFTNVVGDELPLEGTEAISPSLLEMKSVIERAGTFVGIRSGLCDIIRETKAKKIALYPDYNYCDTKWKAIDIYRIEEFDYNILATEEIEWAKL